MNEKWFGARITAPRPGTLLAVIPRARRKVHAYSEVRILTSS